MNDQRPADDGQDPILGKIEVQPFPNEAEFMVATHPEIGNMIVLKITTPMGKFGLFWTMDYANLKLRELTEMIERGRIVVAREMPRA